MIAEILDTAPPHDLDAERALLASIIIKNEIMPEVVASGIKSLDFYDGAHQTTFGEMFHLHFEGKPPDATLLLPRLKAKQSEFGEKASVLLLEFLRQPHSPANWQHYADRVVETSKKRRLRTLGERLLQESTNGKPPNEIAESAIRILDGIKAGTSGTGKVITYRRITCAELAAAEFETEYLIEWLLVAGQPCVVAGPKKACKTTLVIALAIALAKGDYFLDRFRIARCCRVLLMTGESGLATVQETAHRIAAAAGHQLADIGGLIFSDQLPVLGQADHMLGLRKMLVDDEIEVLILDPAYLCLPTEGNEASLFAMGALLREISELCAEVGVTLILIHHTKKGIADPFQPPELEGIAWAGFQEWARQWLLIGRRERYEPGTGEHRLWLSAGGSAGHSSLWALDINEGACGGTSPRQWNVETKTATEAIEQSQENKADRQADQAEQKRAAQLEIDRKAMVRVLVKTKNGETKSALKDRLGIKQGRLDATIASLLDDETIVACEITRANKQTYDAFKINEAKHSDDNQ